MVCDICGKAGVRQRYIFLSEAVTTSVGWVLDGWCEWVYIL